MISAREREADKIMALDHGADDYVEKPFAPGKLLARLRACFRRASQEEGLGDTWRREDVEIDLLRHLVRVGGQEIAISKKEFQLLALLVRSAGRVMTHAQLLTAV